ncbi:MAG: rubrerythrin family protein [Methanomicrobiales archaeon]|nr:rubrerythrin family protein [Methanomicrobiales archaeon]
MDLKGSQTEKNILAAFAGESQARMRYSYFASVAKKEGYEQISAIFQETSDNEREHAKLYFMLLEGGDAQVTASYPAGMIGTTAANLLAAAEGEKLEWSTLYPGFAVVADKEGFSIAAHTFREIAKVEEHHEQRYRKLLANVSKGSVFKKSGIKSWKCRNCGYVHLDISAPDKCPVCDHPQAYYELWCENY